MPSGRAGHAVPKPEYDKPAAKLDNLPEAAWEPLQLMQEGPKWQEIGSGQPMGKTLALETTHGVGNKGVHQQVISRAMIVQIPLVH